MFSFLMLPILQKYLKVTQGLASFNSVVKVIPVSSLLVTNKSLIFKGRVNVCPSQIPAEVPLIPA